MGHPPRHLGSCHVPIQRPFPPAFPGDSRGASLPPAALLAHLPLRPTANGSSPLSLARLPLRGMTHSYLTCHSAAWGFPHAHAPQNLLFWHQALGKHITLLEEMAIPRLQLTGKGGEDVGIRAKKPEPGAMDSEGASHTRCLGRG